MLVKVDYIRVEFQTGRHKLTKQDYKPLYGDVRPVLRGGQHLKLSGQVEDIVSSNSYIGIQFVPLRKHNASLLC
jgi:hypothetical protein